jgi:ABC-2 type transport system permease protein
VVALLVRLKLTLLRNSLRRSVWRTVGLVLAIVYALGIAGGVFVGMVALRYTSVALTADVTVLAFSGLTIGWLLLSLLVFGVDETVDPAKFALLPVRAPELLPGLLVSGLIGVPGAATVVVGLALVIAWARTVPLTRAAVVAVPIGVVTCLLVSRAATAAFASFLSSRRFRDLALVVLALSGAVFGIGGNLVSQFAVAGVGRLRSMLADLAAVAGWSPFGWAWAIPADVARGEWLRSGVHLVLALALVAALWMAWSHFLAARLTSPIEGAAAAQKVREGSFVDRLYPVTPAGAVAARTLRYWRRDTRYLAGIAGFLIAPVVIMVTQLLNPEGSSEVAVLAPTLLGLLAGLTVAQDLSYDGSALWLHISTGLRGAEDRLGRALSSCTIYVPMTVVLLAAAVVASGRWDLLAPVVGVTFALLLIGLGVGSLVGALWQWPAPAPGANPFQRGNSGGLPALLSVFVTMVGTLILGLPTIALLVWSFFAPWVGYLTVPVGLLCGLVVLRVGITQGGRLLDRRWPEVMAAVSERSA